MKHIGKVIGGIMGMFILVALLFVASEIPLNGEKANCYDRLNNKIIGEKCIVENTFDSREMAYTMFGSLGVGVLIIGLTLGGFLLSPFEYGGIY